MRSIKHAIKSILGMDRAAVEVALKLPEADLASIFPDFRPEIKILEPAGANGNVTIHELLAINFAVAACAPKVVFEIGTFDGRTTLNIAANSPGAKIFTLDLPAAKIASTKFALEEYDKGYVDKSESGARFQKRAEAANIVQLYGDSAAFDFTPYFNSIDFIFVDGSHAYEYVLNDSRVALKLLRNGKGTIFWHDYGHVCWPGVKRALEQLQSSESEFRTLQHVNQTTFACMRVG